MNNKRKMKKKIYSPVGIGEEESRDRESGLEELIVS
jgi:hypothetical protein